MRQFRLVHIGVSAAMAAATVTAIGLVQAAGAESGGTASVFVPIDPCRLLDTRAEANNVGARHTPLAATETATFVVWGTNGNCTIPNTATGIATNATAVNPTAASYVTIFPADANPRPTASNLNVVANGPPTPNQVTVRLSAAGAISIYNNGGTVDMILDIVGYYTAASTGIGAQGPKGDKGDPGTNGKDGAPGPTCPVDGCIQFYTGADVGQSGGAAPSISSHCINLPNNGNATLFLNLAPGAVINSARIIYLDSAPGTFSDPTQYRLRTINETFSASPVERSTPFQTPDVVTTVKTPTTLTLTAGRPPESRNTRYFLEINASGFSQSFCGAEVNYSF